VDFRGRTPRRRTALGVAGIEQLAMPCISSSNVSAPALQGNLAAAAPQQKAWLAAAAGNQRMICVEFGLFGDL